MHELSHAKQSLDAALAENRAYLASARQHARARQRSSAAAWCLSPHIEHASLIVYVLAGYTAEPSAHYLRGVAAKRRWPPKSAGALADLVEAIFMRVDVLDIARLSDLCEPSDPRALRAAVRVVHEWRLVTWVRDLNIAKGVAPHTDAVLHQCEHIRLSFPTAAMPPARRGCTESSARMWVSRWRRRWGGRHGTLRVRDDLPVDEMRRKACLCVPHCLILCTQNQDRLAVPKSGPHTTHLLPALANRAQEVLILGPPGGTHSV